MEGPKKIYLFPGIADGYSSKVLDGEIGYIRADLVKELVKAINEYMEIEDVRPLDIERFTAVDNRVYDAKRGSSRNEHP